MTNINTSREILEEKENFEKIMREKLSRLLDLGITTIEDDAKNKNNIGDRHCELLEEILKEIKTLNGNVKILISSKKL